MTDWLGHPSENLFTSYNPKAFNGFYQHIEADLDKDYKDEDDQLIYPDYIAEKAPLTKGGVPKILWRTYKNVNVPHHWREGFESGVKELKDWTSIFMTDEDNHSFVKRHYPHLLSLYENFEYNIQKVDLARILYLYKYGGLYADLDKVFLRDIDHFFEGGDVYLVRSANVYSVFTNSLMGSRPGVKFWQDYIDLIVKNQLPMYAYGKHLKVMNTTGPSVLTQVARNTKSGIYILPGEPFEACSVCQAHNDGCQSSLETGHYVRQIEGSSWIGLDTKVYLCFFCAWPQLVLAIVFVVLILFIHFFTF